MKKKGGTTKKMAEGTHTTTELKRYMGALSEEFQGRVSGIGEQFGGLNQRLDHIDKKIDGMAHSLNQKIDFVARDVAVIKNDVDLIKGDLKRKVDYDDFQALARRVSSLERRRA